MRLLGRVVFAASALLVAVVASNGCGGSKFTASGDDGGAESGVKDGGPIGDSSIADGVSTVDAAGQCVLPPNSVGKEHDFCAFEAAILSRCAYCDTCNVQDANDCVGLGGILSDAFKSALIACEPQLRCDPLISNYAKDPCVLAKLETAQKTSAQMAAKTAYCAGCPTNLAACNGFFEFQGDASNAGLGLWAMIFDDTLAQEVAMSCSSTGSAKCDPGSYNFCAALILCGKDGAPYSHCTKGLCR